MSKVFINKILITLLSATLIISFCIPYCSVFNPTGKIDNEGWENSYIIDDIILITLYTAFGMFWLAYLLLRKSILKTILKLVLIVLSILFFTIALENLVFTAQDFRPGTGFYISVFILPLLTYFLINSNRLNKSTLK